MYAHSQASSDETSHHSPTCCCGRSSDSGSLYRTTTRGSSLSTDGSKMRYGGRGGAGSRPRSIVPSPKCENTSLNRVASSNDAPPPVPAIPSSLAGRRGAANVPSPLVLHASPQAQNVPHLNTPPPLSATTNSTAGDSDFPFTPRSPYFYFDDAFDSSRVQSPQLSPTASTSGTMSRSLRRLASRTQELFLKDRSPKAPPPTPTLPVPSPPPPISEASAPAPTPAPARTPPLTSPSETSLTSEWYDEAPEPSSTINIDPLPAPIVVELPLSGGGGGRTRSASSATVKPRGRRHREKGERRQREREQPRTHGEWNRDDMGEVIVALRMLK